MDNIHVDNNDLHKFLSDYTPHRSGDYLEKRFEEPYLLDIKSSTGRAADLRIPSDYFYRLYLYPRPSGYLEKVKNLTDPTHYIADFINDLYDITFEGGIEEQESRMWKDELGNVFFDLRYVDVCSVLALICKYIDYVSDYSSERDDSGHIEYGKNRGKYRVYYDKSDYWKFAEQTLLDGYGDCEDFSILAVTMTKAIWQRRGWKERAKYYIPRIGICHLSTGKKAHAIIAIEADISFVRTFLTHQFFFKEKTTSDYPYVYCRNDVPLPKMYRKRCNACEWKDNDRFIVLLEPQNYHVKAGTIHIDQYSIKEVYFDDGIIDLGRDYKRVKEGALTALERDNEFDRGYFVPYKIEGYTPGGIW